MTNKTYFVEVTNWIRSNKIAKFDNMTDALAWAKDYLTSDDGLDLARDEDVIITDGNIILVDGVY